MSVNSGEKPCSRCGHLVDIRSEFCPCCGYVFSVASRYKHIEKGDFMFEKERNLIEETKRKFYNSYDEPSLCRHTRKIHEEPALYRRKTFSVGEKVNNDFNLFEILGSGDNVNGVVSRFLCELLSPDGKHDMGTFFLKPFVYDVLKLDIPEFELKRAKAFIVEYQHNGTWVPKIHIRINRRLVVLSLEIYDYFAGIPLSRLSEEGDVYLLTLFGNIPEWLQDDFSKAKCKCTGLSFKHDVMNWVSYCMRQLDVNDGRIYQALSQFSDMIKNRLFEYTNEDGSFTCTDLILSSLENTEAALNIHDEVHHVADHLKNRVLAAIRVHILKTKRLCDFEYYVKIGDDGYLYVRSYIPNTRCKPFEKCYLCNGASPNFKFPNEALFELCDKLTFNVFVSSCVRKILEEF